MSQKVLVVEDDNNIAELLRLYLQKDGFEVSHAADGGKAVEMAKEIQPDLVLLDIMLPVMDGWQVCRELRKTMKMPIIMLTAKGETEDKVSGLEMGADDYIVKPFEVKELLARVHAVLRRTGDDGKPKSKKLTFDKLVINLDSYELIVDGKKIMDDYWTGEQPRACIGQSEKYEILMLVIEGRYPLEGILGTSVNNCSEILLQHKCMQAINLDGGSSAMLWFDGEYVTQSSSSPLRYTGGRPLPNAWVYKKAES